MTREEAISRIQRALSVPNRLQGLVLIDEESANMAIEALQFAEHIENSNQNSAEIIRNEKREENNNVHKAPLYAYASCDRSEE